MTFRLRSTTFEDGEMIPSQHTCDGANVSPSLVWKGVPNGTISLVLIMEDIDAVKGVWSHWVLYNIPSDVNTLAERIPVYPSFVWGGRQGQNDFGDIEEVYLGISHNLCSPRALERLLALHKRYHLQDVVVTNSIPQSQAFRTLSFLRVRSLADPRLSIVFITIGRWMEYLPDLWSRRTRESMHMHFIVRKNGSSGNEGG